MSPKLKKNKKKYKSMGVRCLNTYYINIDPNFLLDDYQRRVPNTV